MPEAGIYGEPIISDMKEAFYMSICWSSVCFDMKRGIIMSFMVMNRAMPPKSSGGIAPAAGVAELISARKGTFPQRSWGAIHVIMVQQYSISAARVGRQVSEAGCVVRLISGKEG